MTLTWPFSKRGARMSAQAEMQPLAALDPLAFSDNDAVIRLWLTEPLAQAIELLSVENHSSRPDVVRSILFEHVYGAAALVQFHIWKRKHNGEGTAHVRESEETGYRSSRNHDFDTFGKANQEFKLHLPAVMRADLEELAACSGITLGDYCRRALVMNLFGIRHSLSRSETA